MEIIKNNTGIFSNFRGYSMYYIATLLSTKDNAESEFKEIMDIFQLLKEKRFWNDAYLPFVAITLYENKDKIDIDNCLTDESNYLAFDSSSYNGFELMLNQKFGIVSLGIYQYMDTYDSFSNGLNGGN